MNAPRAALQRVAALIVNYNAGPWLERCVRALLDGEHEAPEILIVDNGSTDASLDALAGLPVQLDPAGENLGFARGVNRGARQLDCEFLLILNPDCRLPAAGLATLVAELDAHPDAGLVAPKVLDQAGREQRASRRRLPTPWRVVAEFVPGMTGVDLTATPAPGSACEQQAVSGACMLLRRRAFDAVGGMDEGYAFHFEDLDLMARLQQGGWTIRWTPAAEAVHAGGVSSRGHDREVLAAKQRGLERFLTTHCPRRFPRWQRWIWRALFRLQRALA